MDFTIHKELVMDGLPTAFCHASTIIKLRSGGLLCCWFGGSHEGEADVAIYAARRDGAGWSAPVKLADGAEANWNPVLFYREDGTLLLFYKEGQQIVQGHQVHISYTFDRKNIAVVSLEAGKL